MAAAQPENSEAPCSSPSPRAAKPNGDATTEISSVHSGEPSDRKDVDALVNCIVPMFLGSDVNGFRDAAS
ncbi:hypothetical protein GW17_00032528 [Ensete ventricosum]|nr:hypothetical protein GW17_00032528 [Ensete ventricosum]